jgi:hypothetical protein
VPLCFNFVGTIADVDETTPDNPRHPSPVLLIDMGDGNGIERVVLPASVWDKPRAMLQVGRRVRVAGTADILPKPGALPSRSASS